ncbi:transcriptional regulator with XRE-family HTH domain [Sphingomonas zeicaulis]|uniref:helix-turn-helix domain-containing protein n=1 Tax=Sphingomonas zeicaulis TaxID=1632740 RepID=UPI003D22C3D1
MPSPWADRIRSERARCGLNQADFARAGGVARTSQVAYENGGTPPTIAYLLKLGEIGVDPVYILTGRRMDFASDRLDGELAASFNALDEEQKAILLRLAQMLAAAGHAASEPDTRLSDQEGQQIKRR